jgi:diaminopimelate decarboxylase
VPVAEIAAQAGTPVYIYSLRRALENFHHIRKAFASLKPHIHYSAKANANLTLLRTLINAGAGIDAVSGGEIYKALKAGAAGADIVFAGVGKSPTEIQFALEQNVGWFNVENVDECYIINHLAAQLGCPPVQIALRFNPEVTANTHPYIATGHGGAKFGLTAQVITQLLLHQADYPNLKFAGIHIHIGSQLHDINATVQAVQAALELIAPYPEIRAVNIGGGLPVPYKPNQQMPPLEEFAAALTPLLAGYNVILEPGRSIIADAGMLITRILYVKRQAGQTFYITDASMSELIRPALYQAHHEIIPVKNALGAQQSAEGNSARTLFPLEVNIVGPVCETADVLGRDVPLPEMQPGDLLAVLTAGAYGMVMASNYNQRPRPAEAVVSEDGQMWSIARERETWEDLVRLETS